MKKLSILLAAILSCNIFATTSFAATGTTDNYATIESFNFNDGTGTTLDSLLAPSSSYTCAGYEKVDDEHGLSLVLANNRIRYNFANTVDGEVKISFDMYPKGSATKFWITSADKSDAAGGNACYMYNKFFNWWGTTASSGIVEKAWNSIDIVVSDIRGAKPYVKYYVNGSLVKEGGYATSNDAAPNGFVTFGCVATAGNEILLDNIRFSKNISISENFETLAGRWTSSPMFSAKIETLSPAWYWNASMDTSDAAISGNYYNVYKTIDAEHGKSLGSGGSAGALYALPATLKQDATVSFELLTETVATDGAYCVRGNGFNSNWDSDFYICLKGDELRLPNKTLKIEANKWYKIDLKFNIGATCTVDYYVNGNKETSITRNAPKNIEFKSNSRSTEQFTFIDNFNLTVPATKGTFNASAGKTLFVPELDKNTISIKFDKTVDKLSWSASPASVSVAGRNVPIDVVNWNTSATMVEIVLEEDLIPNSEYTVTLPSTLTSIFGDTCAASVEVQTASQLADFEDFNDSDISGRITLPATEINAGVVADGVMTLTGGSAHGNWCQFEYNMPYTVSDGVVKVSFDHYIDGIDSGDTTQTGGSGNRTTAFFRPYGTGTIASTAGMYWLEDAVGVNIVPQLDWVTTDLTEWTNKTWHHYDWIFDLDGKTLKMYMDGSVATIANTEYMEALTRLAFNAGLGTVKVDNLSVKYYDNLGEFETDLENEIDCTKETINVSFKDAVDVDSLNEYFVIKNSKGQVADFEITEATLYGATVAMYEMVADETYTLSLGDTTTLTGDKYANTDITFKAVDKFGVTDAKVLDGETVVSSASAWDAEKEYTLSVDVENSGSEEKTIYVIMAGYVGEYLVNAKVVPVEISNSGTYTKQLGAIDMKNATQIKIFAFNSLEDLAPIMTPAVEF